MGRDRRSKKQHKDHGNDPPGYIQEKGSSKQGIPPRPFLEPGVAKVAKQCADVIGRGAADALTDMNQNAVVLAKNKAGLIAQNLRLLHYSNKLCTVSSF